MYRLRRAALVLAAAAPVIVLAGLWLLVTQVLMVPSPPGEKTPADAVVQFILHPKGLPRLNAERGAAFLEQQLRRLRHDEAFRQRFLAEYRIASSEEQKAFRAHLFDAFKPLVMADIRRFHELPEASRRAFLDERIVAYNRMNAVWADVQISKHDLGPAAPGPEEALELLMQKTTEQERQMGLAYAAALKTRVEEILTDPALKAEFEARIAAPEL